VADHELEARPALANLLAEPGDLLGVLPLPPVGVQDEELRGPRREGVVVLRRGQDEEIEVLLRTGLVVADRRPERARAEQRRRRVEEAVPVFLDRALIDDVASCGP
jgi:hypothetical protein